VHFAPNELQEGHDRTLVRSTLMRALTAQMESLADPPAGGGDKADLFAGTPFKTTGWAGQEQHRQYQ
jgi:hypothetical protein